MANPIIDRIDVSPATIVPGGSATVVIIAHDPDQKIVQLTGKVTDSSGGSSEIKGDVSISDPLTYELVAPAGSGLTVKQSAEDPKVFTVTAAA